MKNNGVLYIVATPIGNLEEVSTRTLNTLKCVDLIACEDTRNTRKLLSHFDIHKKMFSYHNYNEEVASSNIIKELKNGYNVALVSDAGYPLISDPGYCIVNKAIEEKIKITVISGSNAALNALVASGLNTNHYIFYGFLNSKKNQAVNELAELKNNPYTIIFYEAPHRINQTLKLMLQVFGDRKICISRELTKIYEEYLRGNISEFINKEFKGELVLVVEGDIKKEQIVADEVLLKEMNIMINNGYKINDASKFVSKKYNIPKKQVYNIFIKNEKIKL